MTDKTTEAYRLGQRLTRRFYKAIRQYDLIQPDDRILVGLSGGKDSLALVELLGAWRRRHGNSISVTALHVRMDNVEYHSDVQYLNRFCQEHNVAFEWRRGTFDPDRKERRSPCFLCSWNRRKILFEAARDMEAGKIALGHHEDDVLHTLLLNLTYQGTFATMPVRLRMRKFPLTIIRPLCRIAETDIAAWATIRQYQQVLKTCPYDAVGQRSGMRELFRQMEHQNPEIRYNLWHALEKEGRLIQE